MIQYDSDKSALNYGEAISGLLGTEPLSLSVAWDSSKGQKTHDSSSVDWTPAWYRFSVNTEINSLRHAPEHTNSDPPTKVLDLNLYANDSSYDNALRELEAYSN
jgi:hypothetical protein